MQTDTVSMKEWNQSQVRRGKVTHVLVFLMSFTCSLKMQAVPMPADESFRKNWNGDRHFNANKQDREQQDESDLERLITRT